MGEEPIVKKSSAYAIYSVVLALLGFVFWPIGSIPAIFFGVVALWSIKRNPSANTGKKLATVGLVLGFTGLIVMPLFIAYVIKSQIPKSARCILNMSTAQKLVLKHAEIRNLKPGDPISLDDISAALDVAEFFQRVECPTGGTYTVLEKIPDGKTVYYRCDQEGHVLDLALHH